MGITKSRNFEISEKHGGDSKKKDSEGRSCKKIAKDNKAVWNLELIQ